MASRLTRTLLHGDGWSARTSNHVGGGVAIIVPSSKRVAGRERLEDRSRKVGCTPTPCPAPPRYCGPPCEFLGPVRHEAPRSQPPEVPGPDIPARSDRVKMTHKSPGARRGKQQSPGLALRLREAGTGPMDCTSYERK